MGAVLQGTLRHGLDQRLDHLGLEDRKKWQIVEHAVSNVHYADQVERLIAKAVVGAYIGGLTWTHGTPTLLGIEMNANQHSAFSSMFANRFLRMSLYSPA